jgi:hypothetical protein
MEIRIRKKLNVVSPNVDNVVSEMIKIKRIYDSPAKEDGSKILVDRL